MKNNIIKKLTMMALVVCMGCAAVGCSDKNDETSNNGSEETTDDRTTYEILKELDINEYLTLGDYKGLKLEKVITAVTDEEVADEIAAQLEAYPAEVTDRTDVREGDTVNIDFVGRMDGEVFSGGSSEDFDLIIGSNSFIDGFETGLIGAELGETCVLDLNFPDPYPNNTELSGKPVEFTVTINSISAPLEAATDAWVTENIEGCSTVEEFETTIRAMLEETNELTAETQLTYSAWTQVVEATTVHKYPEILVDRGKELYRNEVETYAEYFGMTLDEYLELYGSEEEFEQYEQEYGESVAAQAMINYAICQIEGYEIDGEEFKAELKALAEEYDCTEEELYETYAQDDIEQTVLLNIVCDLLVSEGEVTEVESSSDAE